MPEQNETQNVAVRVGAFDYQLEVDNDVLLDGNYGDIDQARQRIRIAANLAPAMTQNVIWHEVMHGIFYNAGIREHDENLIDVISAGVVQVLQDNPWMAFLPEGDAAES